jgi:hypothetical protein
VTVLIVELNDSTFNVLNSLALMPAVYLDVQASQVADRGLGYEGEGPIDPQEKRGIMVVTNNEKEPK